MAHRRVSCWALSKQLLEHSVCLADLKLESQSQFFATVAAMRQAARGDFLPWAQVREKLLLEVAVVHRRIVATVTNKPWLPLSVRGKRGYDESIIKKKAPKREDDMWGEVFQVQEVTDVEKDMQEYAEQLLAKAIAKRQEARDKAFCLQSVISEK